MIILNSDYGTIHLPKLERKKLDAHNLYYLILHNNYTKEIWLFKMRDINSNPARFNLYYELPENFQQGEYTYYLVSYDDWNIEQLSSNYPANSQITAQKEAITHNGMYIISGNTILVTGNFKGKLMLKGNDLLWQEKEIIIKSESDDLSSHGKIVKEVNVLNCGLLKYHLEEKICCNNFIEYDGGEQEKYIQYNG